jgi:Zn-dependent peptidase ImmA (M78 family)
VVNPYADRLLQEAGIDAVPVDLYKVAEAKNVIIKEDDVEGYAGMLMVMGDVALISVNRAIRETTRKRFTIAHELGHFSIPGHIVEGGLPIQCTDSDLSMFGEKNPGREVEANYFAAELLMPRARFRKDVQKGKPTRDFLSKLCDTYDTSLTATSIRFITFRPEYALVCSEKCRIKWFHQGADFPLFLDTMPGSPLHEDSYAYDFFKEQAVPEDFEDVNPLAWIDDRRLKDSMTIMEMVVCMPAYDTALSFLYIEDSGDSDYEDDYCKQLDGHLRFRRP